MTGSVYLIKIDLPEPTFGLHKEKRGLMKRFLFYLNPMGCDSIRTQPPILFKVIISSSIDHAAHKFSDTCGTIYCGMMKITQKKYHVYYSQRINQQDNELMYVVIEDEIMKHFDY